MGKNVIHPVTLIKSTVPIYPSSNGVSQSNSSPTKLWGGQVTLPAGAFYSVSQSSSSLPNNIPAHIQINSSSAACNCNSGYTGIIAPPNSGVMAYPQGTYFDNNGCACIPNASMPSMSMSPANFDKMISDACGCKSGYIGEPAQLNSGVSTIITYPQGTYFTNDCACIPVSSSSGNNNSSGGNNTMACNQSAIDNYTYYLNNYETALSMYNASPSNSSYESALKSAASQFVSTGQSLMYACTSANTLTSSQLSTIRSSLSNASQTLTALDIATNENNFYTNTFEPAWNTANTDYNSGNYSGALTALQNLLSAIKSMDPATSWHNGGFGGGPGPLLSPTQASEQNSIISYYNNLEKPVSQSITNIQSDETAATATSQTSSLATQINTLWQQASSYYNAGQYSQALSTLQQLLSIVQNNQSAMGSYYSQYYNAITQSITNIQNMINSTVTNTTNTQSLSTQINTLWQQASSYYNARMYSSAVYILEQLLSLIENNQSALGSYYSQYYNVVYQSILNLSKL